MSPKQIKSERSYLFYIFHLFLFLISEYLFHTFPLDVFQFSTWKFLFSCAILSGIFVEVRNSISDFVVITDHLYLIYFDWIYG
jgi:hypothetical protein